MKILRKMKTIFSRSISSNINYDIIYKSPTRNAMFLCFFVLFDLGFPLRFPMLWHCRHKDGMKLTKTRENACWEWRRFIANLVTSCPQMYDKFWKLESCKLLKYEIFIKARGFMENKPLSWTL
jgi:hypothetical protein